MQSTKQVQSTKLMSAKLVCITAAFLLCCGASAQETCRHSMNKYEQQAIKIADAFVIALVEAKNADKAASYMADNVQFRSNTSEPTIKGRDAALRMFRQQINTKTPGIEIGAMKIEQTCALGGADEVIVIQRRVDELKVNGKSVSGPLGAIFRISPKDWKIEEWIEAPLQRVDFGIPLPPPPSNFATEQP